MQSTYSQPPRNATVTGDRLLLAATARAECAAMREGRGLGGRERERERERETNKEKEFLKEREREREREKVREREIDAPTLLSRAGA